MAEPTLDVVLKILPYLIPGVASILVPVVGWILSSIGLGRKQKQIEYLLRRLDLNEKLRTRVEKSANEEDLKFLAAEFTEILNYFKSTAVTAERPATIIPLRLAKFRSTFLLYNPHSVKGWVYHVVFYFSLQGILIGLLFSQEAMGFRIYISVFYFIVAVVFQRLAVMNARKSEERGNRGSRETPIKS